MRAARTAWTVSGMRPSSAGSRPASPPAADEAPLVDQVAEDLLDEERVALGALDDPLPTSAGSRRPSRSRPTGGPRPRAVERIEEDAREAPPPAAPGRSPVGELGPRRAERSTRPGDAVGELLEQVEQRRVRPVDVLDDRDQRVRGRRGPRRTSAKRRSSGADLLGVMRPKSQPGIVDPDRVAEQAPSAAGPARDPA